MELEATGRKGLSRCLEAALYICDRAEVIKIDRKKQQQAYLSPLTPAVISVLPNLLPSALTSQGLKNNVRLLSLAESN